jgi:hypothetical protein
MKGDTALKARDVEGLKVNGGGGKGGGKGGEGEGKGTGIDSGGAGTSGEAARTLEKSRRPPARSLPRKYPLSWRQQMAALNASLRQGHIGQSLLLFVCSAQSRCKKNTKFSNFSGRWFSR